MRYLILSALLLAGCGSSETYTETAAAPLPSPVPVASPANPGQTLLAALSQAIAALGPEAADLLYAAAAEWDDANPELTGSVAVAVNAAQTMGAEQLYQLLSPMDDDGQAVVTTYGATFLEPNRTRDCLAGVAALQQTTGRNAAVIAALSPDLNSMPKFHALRLLAPAAIPPQQRQVFKALRDGLPLPANGQMVQKAIKLGDMSRYLNGTFDPKAFGFAAVQSDVASLVTPAQIIEGLRLDYPGGFANETRLALLQYPQTSGFTLQTAYNATFGGNTTGDYPFTGNGFTATTQANAIPEWVLPRSGADLAPGSRLVEVAENGQQTVRGTWTGTAWTTPAGDIAADQPTRQRVEKPARYRGQEVYVISRADDTAFVASSHPLPNSHQVGRDDFRGQLPWSDLGW